MDPADKRRENIITVALPDTTSIRLIDAAQAAVGAGSARQATSADAVDGVAPRLVIEPPDAAAVAAALAWASQEKLCVVTRGAGTKLEWGTTPQRVDVVLSTARLHRVIAHRHGDLTATVEAGAALAGVNRELAQHRQWIPLDPPWSDRATLGGIVATNDSGPRRHQYGAPRDLIIGIGLARADGRLAKAGGIVVKNVAGYDLARLLTGSFGALAVIVSLTFKLFPVPRASRTVVADFVVLGDLEALVSSLLASPLTPTALELEMPPARLLVRFESIDAAADQQASEAVRLAVKSGGAAKVVQDAEETDLWERHNRRPWAGQGAIVKVSLLPSELRATLAWLRDSTGACEVIGRAGVGVLLVRIDGDVATQARVITGLRSRLGAGLGSAVVVRASRELKTQIDVWGSIGDVLGPMRAIKRQFDPAGILNPGRGPGGL